jgi:hypothetical protein
MPFGGLRLNYVGRVHSMILKDHSQPASYVPVESQALHRQLFLVHFSEQHVHAERVVFLDCLETRCQVAGL